MASEYADPPAPQASINTSSAKNRQARPGPYVDQSLTLENVDSTPAAALDVPPPKSPATSQGDIRPVYANDQKSNLENTMAAEENQDVDPPPHAPNKWGIETDASIAGHPISRSRDPYRNDGLEPYLRNQGE